jgi:hypothetical protein
MPKLISQKNNYNEAVIYKTVSTTNQVVVDSFSKNQYQSAKYQIQVENSNNFQTTEFLVVHDGINTHTVEYGTINTSNSLSSFTTDLSGTSIRLLATPANSTETKFILIRKPINS